MTDQPLIAVSQLLTSGAHRQPARRRSDIRKACAQIDRCCERTADWTHSLARDAGILHLRLERQRLRRGDRRIHAEPGQPVEIVATAVEASAIESLHALAKLTTDADPRGKDAVEAIGEWRLRGGSCRLRT